MAEFLKAATPVLEIVDVVLGTFMVVALIVFKELRLEAIGNIRKLRDRFYERFVSPYREGDYRYKKRLLVKRTFTAETLAGFRVPYSLYLWVERSDNVEFNNARMLEESAQNQVADDYNKDVVAQFFLKPGYFSTWGRQLVLSKKQLIEGFAPKLGQVHQEDGKLGVRELLPIEIKEELEKYPPYKHSGCVVTLSTFSNPEASSEIVEENYAMLTTEQKKQVQSSDEYAAFVERLAVAALKRQHDLLDNKKQELDSNDFSMQTLIAGKGVKISWQIKASAPRDYYLVGVRATGGFGKDIWYDFDNAVRMAESHQSGSVTEILEPGQTYFYTFIYVTRDSKRTYWGRSSIRFQVRIPTNEELDEIRKPLAPKEEKVPKQNEGVSNALKELGLVMEFHEEIDKMEESFIARIKGKQLAKEDEARKIEFVRDVVRLQREKYEP